jgi:hypothetical protein
MKRQGQKWLQKGQKSLLPVILSERSKAIISTEDLLAGRNVLSIYEVNGDELRICGPDWISWICSRRKAAAPAPFGFILDRHC